MFSGHRLLLLDDNEDTERVDIFLSTPFLSTPLLTWRQNQRTYILWSIEQHSWPAGAATRVATRPSHNLGPVRDTFHIVQPLAASQLLRSRPKSWLWTALLKWARGHFHQFGARLHSFARSSTDILPCSAPNAGPSHHALLILITSRTSCGFRSISCSCCECWTARHGELFTTKGNHERTMPEAEWSEFGGNLSRIPYGGSPSPEGCCNVIMTG